MATATKASHTAGPWHLNEWGRVVDADGNNVRFGNVTVAGGNILPASVKANDALIAAAPDLLAHLRIIVDGIAEGVEIPRDGAAINAARAAIEKATGATP